MWQEWIQLIYRNLMSQVNLKTIMKLKVWVLPVPRNKIKNGCCLLPVQAALVPYRWTQSLHGPVSPMFMATMTCSCHVTNIKMFSTRQWVNHRIGWARSCHPVNQSVHNPLLRLVVLFSYGLSFGYMMGHILCLMDDKGETSWTSQKTSASSEQL